MLQLPFEYIPLFVEDMHVWARESHPLFNQDTITVDQLVSYPVPAFVDAMYDESTVFVQSLYDTVGRSPNFRYKCLNNVEEYLSSIENDEIAFGDPQSFSSCPGLASKRIDGIRKILYMVMRVDTSSKVLAEFAKFLQDYVATKSTLQ